MKFKNFDKIIITIIILSLIFTIYQPLGKSNIENKQSEVIEINIGICTNELFIGSGWDKYEEIIQGYSWNVGNIKYVFNAIRINDKTIFSGELTPENFDMIVMPGGGGGDHSSFTKSFVNIPRIKIWRENFKDYIKSGGSYYGTCSGVTFPLKHDREPETFYEIFHNKGCLDISCFLMHCSPVTVPPFSQFLGEDVDKTGSVGYVMFSGWNYSKHPLSGVPIDVPIDRNHPIFSNCKTNTTRVTWIGGPGIIFSDNVDREAEIIARFPEWEICENETVQIKSWKYTGGLKGMFNSFFKELRKGNNPVRSPSDFFMNITDWECTGAILQTDNADTGFMTAETFPNENQGRIVLISGHPECKVWWGGHIENHPETDSNNLYDGLHEWVDVIPFNQTIEDEKTHAYWIIRRSIAWGSKIPESDLPPIYGPSRIKELESYIQPTDFSIISVHESSNKPYHLDLYYKFSTNNESWTDWIKYSESIDNHKWDFNGEQAMGCGYYQFASIRTEELDYSTNIERFPPGPDIIVQVN